MSTFAVMAHRASPTNTRLGRVLTPAQCVTRLQYGDVVLGRLDVRQSLDGIEAGLWALDRLAQSGVKVLNDPGALATAHDKLATAWHCTRPAFRIPKRFTSRPGRSCRSCGRPSCSSHDSAAGAATSFSARPRPRSGRHSPSSRPEAGSARPAPSPRSSIPPHGYDIRIVVAGGRVAGAIRRVAAPGEWRTNVVLGGRREPVYPTSEACAIAIAAAGATGGALVGVDLLPTGGGGWVVAEVNGAVDFTSAYSLGRDVFDVVREALTPAREPVAAAV